MTTNVDIANRALLGLGIPKKITSLTQDSTEAQVCSQFLTSLRDDLLRLAPWDCAANCDNLVYITSLPGTPENTAAASTTWQKGIPAPPWTYEYQYPVDCLRALYIISQGDTGFTGDIPITNAVTGTPPYLWNGPPIRFKVAVDQFYSATAISSIASVGTGHAVNDIITLATSTIPLGARFKVRVLTVSGGGGILTAELVSCVLGETLSGSYFTLPTNPLAQDTTTGVGTGASFNLTIPTTKVDQRVILTDQRQAILSYVKQVTDPNVMDTLFQSAWTDVLSANLAYVLMQDKAIANQKILEANNSIIEARKADGNEGLTIIDSTPDWIRARGYIAYNPNLGPNLFDWGPLWPTY